MSFDYEEETHKLKFFCASMVEQVKKKFDQYTDLVRSQIELKRLIKRNKKEMESVKKVVGRKRGTKLEAPKEQRLVCTIPFLVVKYHPENIKVPEDSIILHRKKMKLTSVYPLKCYGDSTILSKMKLQELEENETYENDVLSLLGSHGPTIPETIKRIDESINQIQDKYNQLREQSCK